MASPSGRPQKYVDRIRPVDAAPGPSYVTDRSDTISKTMPRTKAAPPKWRRCPADRPVQIIKAALDVFGEYGLANARLQDIAAKAGISKGTIYLYFPNKEELFREMIRQTAVAAISRAETLLAEGNRNPTAQL